MIAVKIKYCSAVSLASALIITLSGCGNTAANKNNHLIKGRVSYKTIQASEELLPAPADAADWTKAAENEYLTLYYREDTAAVRVFDKRSGSIWNSNPVDGETSNAAASQLTLSTVNAKGVIKNYTSYSDSLIKGQVDFECDGALTVTYTFGNKKPDLSGIPSRLTDKRFAELQRRVEAANGNTKLLERRYIKGDDGVWTRKANLTADQSKKLRELFEKINYTAEEAVADEKSGGTSEEKSTSFSVPLKYSLEEDSLLVSISGKDTVYPDGEIITSLNVLGYFGSVKTNENGYFFVPDGSGALVDTTVRDSETYSLKVYGIDYTLPIERESGNSEPNLMPVFGISRKNDGLFAIIEDNDAVASINISKAGNIDEYNTVSASFAVDPTENIGLSTDSVSKFYVTSESRYAGDTVIRYIFLDGEHRSYSGMAEVYRNYLDTVNGRKRLDKGGSVSLFIETVGAVKGKASTLGFVHEKNIALTSFNDDASIIEDMNNAGIKNVRLILSGWMNGGEEQCLADRAKAVTALGGKSGLLKLLRHASSLNCSVYPEILLNTFSNNDSVITKNIYASETLGSEKSKRGVYDKLTGNSVSADSGRYLLSPSKQESVSDSLIRSLNKISVNGVLIADLSSTVYSDYKSKNEILRQASLLQSEKIVSRFSGKSDDLMLTAPNVYTAPYSKIYTDVPMSSGSYRALKCSVPFYQMVFHGYSEYSSEPLNYTADFETNLLKCAEYGASPKFRFIYNDTENLSPGEQTQYYAASYSRWRDTAIDAYKQLDALLGSVRNSVILEHKELSDGVYLTVYDNGTSIFVNYNDTEQTVNGVKVPSMTAIKKEEKADEKNK